MSRKLILIAFLTFVLVCGLSAAFQVKIVEASETIYIRADGSIDPPDAPIITYDNITYTLTDNITSSGDGIVVERDNVIIDGASHVLQGIGTGIDLTGRNNVTIKNMEIRSFLSGFRLYSSSNNSIIENSVTNNFYYGISLQYSSCNNISQNNIIANKGSGICISYSTNNILRNNNMSNNKYDLKVYGVSLLDFLNDIDTSNIVSGKRVYYWINETSRNVPLDAGYVVLVNCAHITVKNLNLTKNGQGILMAYTINSTITKNNITKNEDFGIWLVYSLYNSIFENNITKTEDTLFGDGIRLYYSVNNVIYKNNITSNSGGGISFWDSSYNNITVNNITANYGHGIFLSKSSNNSIYRNEIISIYAYGILQDRCSYNDILKNNISNGGVGLSESCNNNISGNNVTDSSRGIWLDSFSDHNTVAGNNLIKNRLYGIYLTYSSNNIFYHNNFINNTQQVQIPYSGYANVWDDGCEGNYWSDYNGTDADGDAIGDTAYVIDANNQDNYPLMGMFSDINATSEYHIQTICNSSISDFQYNGTAISFNVSGDNGTAGFCRICIPTALMNITYRVFVNGTEILPSPEPLPCSNTTHTYLYFSYAHSTQEVIIIPEFPSFLILPLFMIATLLAAILYRRKGYG